MTNKPRRQRAGLGTSGDSVRLSESMARGLRGRIVRLVSQAGPLGMTIGEAERQIRDHKAHSISPRFSELEKTRALVRSFVGYGRPTMRFPKGVPRFFTRHDEETRRNVNVYWVPEFAPAATDHGDKSNGVEAKYHD
jgi:hypothetical protein